MTQLMYDSITANNLPVGGTAYAAYINGNYANVAEVAVRFPGVPLESIDVLNQGIGTVLDVETGDATPTDAPGWLATRKAAGVARPALYAGLETWITALVPQGRPPRIWTAHYTQVPHLCDSSCVVNIGGVNRTLPAGWVADATQYSDPGPYDVSLLGPNWLITAPPPAQKANPMLIISYPGAPGQWTFDGTSKLPIPDAATAQTYINAGTPTATLTAAAVNAIPNTLDVIADLANLKTSVAAIPTTSLPVDLHGTSGNFTIT